METHGSFGESSACELHELYYKKGFFLEAVLVSYTRDALIVLRLHCAESAQFSRRTMRAGVSVWDNQSGGCVQRCGDIHSRRLETVIEDCVRGRKQ